jgi:hypothetical protein
MFIAEAGTAVSKKLTEDPLSEAAVVYRKAMKRMVMDYAVPAAELIKKYATRALAIFGENEIVRQAINRRPIVCKGVRILCMDGGGMRGISTVQMLQRIEVRIIFLYHHHVFGQSTAV